MAVGDDCVGSVDDCIRSPFGIAGGDIALGAIMQDLYLLQHSDAGNAVPARWEQLTLQKVHLEIGVMLCRLPDM